MEIEQETCITIESKIYNPNIEILRKYGTIQQSMCRCLFNKLKQDNISYNQLQYEYIRRFNVHARVFKSAFIETKSDLDSIISNLDNRISYFIQKIQEYKTKIKNIAFAKKKNKKLFYHLTNKLNNLEQRLVNAKDIKNNPCKIKRIWGSKSFFKKQWQKDQNHEQWLAEWKRKRDYQLYLIGSKDETFGNSLCQLQNLNKIRLTLPKKFNQKYLFLDVNFNHQKKHYQYLIHAINQGKSLTWRLIERENGCWYAQVTFKVKNNCKVQKSSLGIDINYNLFASCLVKEDGNPEEFEDFRVDLTKSKNQNREQLIQAAIKLAKKAKDHNKNLVIEKIDLRRCRNKDQGKLVNRKLHLIAYDIFIKFLKSAATKLGVFVKEINPAYTSIIGKIKYMYKLGRSRHSSASYVIGRRGMGLSEKIPSFISLLHREEKKKHEWAQWHLLAKRINKVVSKHSDLSYCKIMRAYVYDS